MKKLKAVVCAGMALAVISSAAAFAGCQTNETPNETLSDFQITYQKYRAYAEAMGDDVLSYEEWLEDIKGEDGKDGSAWKVGNIAPVDSEGKDGDLYLNSSNFDIYLKTSGAWNKIGNIKGAQGIQGEQGIQGKSAYQIWKENNPDEDLSETEWLESLKGSQGIQGVQGVQGNPGADGTKWFTGVAESPSEEDSLSAAKDGDFYFNTEKFEIWQKVGGSWQSLGSFGSLNNESAKKVEIAQGGEATVPLNEVQLGWNYVYADLGDATLAKDTNLQAYIGSGKHSAFFKSEEQSASGNNVYFGLVNVTSNEDQLTLAAAEQSVSAAISFKSLNDFTIKNDIAFETAITKDGSFKLELDDAMLEIARNRNSNNKIKWTINIDSNGYIASLAPLDDYATIDFIVSANCGFAPTVLCQQITDKVNFNKTSTINSNFNAGDKYLTITSSVGDDLIHPCIVRIKFETVADA